MAKWIFPTSLTVVLCSISLSAYALPCVDVPAHTAECVPDFGALATKVSTASGTWSNPAIWSPVGVPGNGEIVRIANNSTIEYDLSSTTAIKSITVEDGSALKFSQAVDTKLRVETLLVKKDGLFEIGNENSPLPPSRKAEVSFTDGSADAINDPLQFGGGLVGIGKIRIVGSSMERTFIRAAEEIQAGATVIKLLHNPVGWRIGDKILIPSTRFWHENDLGDNYANYWNETETATIAAISGTSVTLTSGVTYKHGGVQEAKIPLTGNLLRNPFTNEVLLPHIGNLSRNILLHSENPDGRTAHTIYIGPADVNISYAEFREMSRSYNSPWNNTTFLANGSVDKMGENQRGRYTIHLHHTYGRPTPQSNGHQFTVVGNSIYSLKRNQRTWNNQRRWAIGIHNASWGLVAWNVTFNLAGSHISTESSNEIDNIIEKNFSVFAVSSRAGDGDRGNSDIGHAGQAHWYANGLNYVRNNVAADMAAFSFYPVQSEGVWLPTQQGKPNMDPWRKKADIAYDGIVQFEGNEFYGNTVALNTYSATIWSMGVRGSSPYYDSPYEDPVRNYVPSRAGEMVLKNTMVWNNSGSFYFNYKTDRLTWDGLAIFVDPSILLRGLENRIALVGGDYDAWRHKVKNFKTSNVALSSPTTTGDGPKDGSIFGIYSFENGEIIANTGLYLAHRWNLGIRPGGITEQYIRIKNVSWEPVPGYVTNNPDNPASFVKWQLLGPMVAYGAPPTADYRTLRRVTVENFNKDPDLDFQLFSIEQAPGAIFPMSTDPYPNGYYTLYAAIEPGLTNYQHFLKYGSSLSGELASCNTNITMMSWPGFTCPLESTDSTAPSQPSIKSVSVNSSGDATVSWNAAIDDNGSPEYVLDVAKKEDFSSFVPAYQARAVGSVLSEIVRALPEGKYYTRVRAVDAALNLSDNSEPVEFVVDLPDVTSNEPKNPNGTPTNPGGTTPVTPVPGNPNGPGAPSGPNNPGNPGNPQPSPTPNVDAGGNKAPKVEAVWRTKRSELVVKFSDDGLGKTKKGSASATAVKKPSGNVTVKVTVLIAKKKYVVLTRSLKIKPGRTYTQKIRIPSAMISSGMKAGGVFKIAVSDGALKSALEVKMKP